MYYFCYRGELVEGADQDKVLVNLARLFSITEEEAAQLFETDKEFFRDDLDQATAHDYLTVFNRAGAKGHIHKSTPKSKAKNSNADSLANSPEQQHDDKRTTNISSSSNEPVADKQRVSHTQETSEQPVSVVNEQTPSAVIENNISPRIHSHVDYGSHVMKHLAASDSKNNRQSSEASSPESVTDAPKPKTPRLQHNKKSPAARWLRIGGIAIVGTMIADQQLQSALTIDRFGFDIGYWPLILAHIPLVIGCYFLAREKRLSPIFGAFGLLSFAGLSILLLMPAKGAKDHKIGLAAVAMTIFSCGVFFYWFGGALQSSANTQNLHDQLLLLRDGREEFPSTQRQGQIERYSSEQNELYQTMTDVIALVNRDELRPDQTTELSNAMMSEIARYIAWRQHQQFLHHTNGDVLPEGLNSQFQEDDEIKIGGLLRGITPQSNKRLYESTMSWTVAPIVDSEYTKTISLRRQLDHIHDTVRDGWLAQTEKSQSVNANTQSANRPPTIDVAMLNLPNLNGAELVKHQNHVEYVFNTGPLSGKTLAIGFYTVKNPTRGNRKASYSPRYSLLNNEVPAIYMSNLMSVFASYTKPSF